MTDQQPTAGADHHHTIRHPRSGRHWCTECRDFIVNDQVPDDTIQTQLTEARAEVERLTAERDAARAALARLVELGNDDGSAPERAWKDAFEHAQSLLAALDQPDAQEQP